PRLGPSESDADDQPAHPARPGGTAREEEGACAAAESAKARRVHARLYDDAEEAELGAAQGRQGSPHQWFRSDRLYPRRGTQSARALGGDDPRRPREGPAGRSLPHHPRRARYAGREKPQAAPFEIRRQTAEVIGSNACHVVTAPINAKSSPIRSTGIWSFPNS